MSSVFFQFLSPNKYSANIHPIVNLPIRFKGDSKRLSVCWEFWDLSCDASLHPRSNVSGGEKRSQASWGPGQNMDIRGWSACGITVFVPTPATLHTVTKLQRGFY